MLVAYRHGLRAKEACELEWSQISAERRDQHHAHDGAAADTVHAVQARTKLAFSGFKLALFEPQ